MYDDDNSPRTVNAQKIPVYCNVADIMIQNCIENVNSVNLLCRILEQLLPANGKCHSTSWERLMSQLILQSLLLLKHQRLQRLMKLQLLIIIRQVSLYYTVQGVTEGNKADTQCASSSIKSCEMHEILFNPNVFTEFKLAGRQEEIEADEENVRKASSYLLDVVLPKFIQDLCTLEVSPMDCQTPTEALHAHGLNIRYFGNVANGTKHLPRLWDLCSNEIVVRSAKHILKDVLRGTEDHDLGLAIAHFFSCFFGSSLSVAAKLTCSSMSKNQKKEQASHQSSGKTSKGHSSPRWKGKPSARKNISSYMNFELPEDARSRVKKISVLRNLCQKVGINITASKYDFNAATPFHTSDILNLQPVVKHSVPVCSGAKDLVEMGKVHLVEGMLTEAYTMFSEAFSILQQVTGPMHREVANCRRYGSVALFYHGLNQTELALRHMSRALLLLSLSSGPDHPNVAATFINVAMMYQDIQKMNTALCYLQEALKKNERLLCEDHIQTAVCYHALAVAMKRRHDILVKQLGEEDSRTRDSQNWMKTFKMRELQASLASLMLRNRKRNTKSLLEISSGRCVLIDFSNAIFILGNRLKKIAGKGWQLALEFGMAKTIKTTNQSHHSKWRSIQHTSRTKTKKNEKDGGSGISTLQQRLESLPLCCFVVYNYLNPPCNGSKRIIPRSNYIMNASAHECLVSMRGYHIRIRNRTRTRTDVRGFFQLQTSPNNRLTEIMPDTSDMMQKKLALLLLMLHMWESASNIYSTTSFLRGDSALPSRLATIFMAWYLRLSG
ncbi:Clustered mitochondria protein [Hibiscus syriacus]|uniref:Clustered mitochondria protein n=1 Tax=Hibiscus syriacus TaxID=106335 RepID=A0A6A3AGF3_HIBSY|nr:Clustered mitochondria protein [Hibiscus syriacus]